MRYHRDAPGAPVIATKLALLNVRSLANQSFLVNGIIIAYNLDVRFLTETRLAKGSSATVLNKTSPEHLSFMKTCQTGRKEVE